MRRAYASNGMVSTIVTGWLLEETQRQLSQRHSRAVAVVLPEGDHPNDGDVVLTEHMQPQQGPWSPTRLIICGRSQPMTLYQIMASLYCFSFCSG